MYCRDCGSFLQEGQTVCPVCGAWITEDKLDMRTADMGGVVPYDRNVQMDVPNQETDRQWFGLVGTGETAEYMAGDIAGVVGQPYYSAVGNVAENMAQTAGQPYYSAVGNAAENMAQMAGQPYQSAVGDVAANMAQTAGQSYQSAVGDVAANTAQTAGASGTAGQAAGHVGREAIKHTLLHTAAGKAALALGVVVLAGGTAVGVLAYQQAKSDKQTTEVVSTIEAVSDAGDTTEDTQAPTTTEATTTEEVTTEAPVEYASQYLEILQENETEIRAYDQHRIDLFTEGYSYDYLDCRPIAIKDITGDDIPELLYITTQYYDGQLWDSFALSIYTVENNQAKQIYYEEKWDMQAVEDMDYCLFQTEDDSTLYAYNNSMADPWEAKYYRFDMQGNGLLKKVELMTLREEADYDGIYTVGQQETDKAEFIAEETALVSGMCTNLMYNDYPWNQQELLQPIMQKADYIAMTYDEAIAFLSEEVGSQGTTGNGDTQQSATVGTKNVMPFKEAQSFFYSSGVGAWSSDITIYPDGIFMGKYYDSNAGEFGEGYDCTMYVSTFHGSFTDIQKVDEYTYSMRLESLETEETETEWIETDEVTGTRIRYVASAAAGIDGGNIFYLYLPGKPINELPEYYVDWAKTLLLFDDSTTEMLDYGFYNEDGEAPFF